MCHRVGVFWALQYEVEESKPPVRRLKTAKGLVSISKARTSAAVRAGESREASASSITNTALKSKVS